MVLEEESATIPTRLVELITQQPRGGSRWFVQHMPRSGNAVGNHRQISHSEGSRQSDVPLASTSEDVKEEAAATMTTAIVAQVMATTIEQAEELDQSVNLETARAEVAHRAYRNTRVSVTILRCHQGQEAEHIHSFDITDPTFEKEIFSELITYGEEDDTGVDENDEPPLEFQPYDDDPEGPNLHVEDETEVINIGTAEEVKAVRISAKLSPQARAEFLAFLKEYANIFAWSYDDMVGLDVEIVVLTLLLKPDAKLVKQKLRR